MRETDGTVEGVRLAKTGRRGKPFYPGREAKTFHFSRGRLRAWKNTLMHERSVPLTVFLLFSSIDFSLCDLRALSQHSTCCRFSLFLIIWHIVRGERRKTERPSIFPKIWAVMQVLLVKERGNRNGYMRNWASAIKQIRFRSIFFYDSVRKGKFSLVSLN